MKQEAVHRRRRCGGGGVRGDVRARASGVSVSVFVSCLGCIYLAE